MAKRKRKKNGFFHRLFKQVVNFFIPQEIRSKRGWLWFGSSRLGAGLGGIFVLLLMAFSVLPVPFSSYMAQQKVSHWLAGDRYTIKYDWVSLDRIAWQMQMAVIAGEDQKFDHHFGIDVNAILIALQKNARSNKVRGASTISQQMVKNLFLWHGTSWLRKGIELPLTFAVENAWSKRRILEIYLNIAEFGDGIFGVEAAAQHFFKKSAKELNLQEAALLAASLPNPLIYKVNRPGPTMKKRQQWIIRQVGLLGGRTHLAKLQ